MKRVRLFESFINEKGAVLGRGRKSVRVDFNDKRNMRWTVHGMQGDIRKGIVILIATEYKQGQPSWWKLARVIDGEIKFQESELGEIPEWLKKKAIKDAGKYGFKNLKEVNESVEAVNEAEGKFDKALHKKVLKAIASTKTYMDVEDEDDMREIFLSTRENGNVGNETPGRADMKEAERVQKILQKKFPDLKFGIDTTDEWTNLQISQPTPVEYRYEYRVQGSDTGRSGGGDEFETFEELVDSLENPYVGGNSSGYGLKGIDWKAVKKELDSITEFPRDLFVGWHRSKLIPLTKVGGNDIFVAKKRSDQ